MGAGVNREGQIDQWATSLQAGRTIVYKYDLPGESLYDTPTVFFTADFLRAPSFDWTVDFSGAHCDYVRNGHWLQDECGCRAYCLAGVIAKSPDPLRVWRLTGNVDEHRPDVVGYEGKWPD